MKLLMLDFILKDTLRYPINLERQWHRDHQTEALAALKFWHQQSNSPQ